MGLDATSFRALFPALTEHVWLDTPGSPPAAIPVVEALTSTLQSWSSGDFSWLDWDHVPQQARRLFARYVDVEPDQVTNLGSVAEAAAIVAASLPPGRIVVPDDEFRSNLLPWLQRDDHDVVRVPSRDGVTSTEDLVAACTPGTVLLATSEVLSSTGVRADVPALRAATDAVGARLFVDATQAMGVLDPTDTLRADYIAVHGYKWMLCPRGAAWMVTRKDLVADLHPIAPSWRSGPPPHSYFGGVAPHERTGAAADSSPAWLSWIGAVAALELLNRTDARTTESHSVGLAQDFVLGARDIGLEAVSSGRPSHIAAVHITDRDRVSSALLDARVKATVSIDRVRVGFHYFNTPDDVERALTALRHADAAGSSAHRSG
ncbi:MAG: aminotransferase class V-fold PLP-dependent enzyme [Aeromicrobium sp.]|nr:aminotransferase class V-fold PLP-dependent enzyme [Aeromicrobium sp.]